LNTEELYQGTLKGCRNTKHRQEILDTMRLFEVPATVDDIYAMFKYQNIDISMSTIYRNLEKLTEKGVVLKTIMMDDNKARYELNRERDKHYIICVKCNKIFPIDYCPFDQAGKDLFAASGFEITGHKFEIYGYCPDCKKQKSE